MRGERIVNLDLHVRARPGTIPAVAILDRDPELIHVKQISLELLAGSRSDCRRFDDSRWVQKPGLQVGWRILIGDPGKVASGRVAFGTAAHAVKKCFAARGIAGEQKFQRVVLGPAWTSTVRFLKPLVQESNDIVDLAVIEPDRRHALGGPAIANHRTDEIAVFVVPHEHGTHQVWTLSTAVRIDAVTKSAGLRKLRLAAFCGLLTQGDKARHHSQQAGENEAHNYRDADAEVFYQVERHPWMLAALLTRHMTLDDVPAGLRLCRLSGWNQVEEDWTAFLRLSPDACRIVENNGAIVGTVATLRFAEKFSWIAMVLVDPPMRGQGIGTELLQEALTILKNEKCIRLDATDAGARIYRTQGFEEEYRLNRLVAEAPAKPIANADMCRPISNADLEEVFDLDKRVFGADRSALLRSFLMRAPEYAWVSRTGPTLAGYVFGRHGYHHEHIGPLVATDGTTSALGLLSCCLAHNQARSVLIDAPDDRDEWNRWLQNAGFRRERSFVRMYRGSKVQPECETYQFGIAGPEFG
jgi:ribosomal protein S18 acetylase RimI-like enzyme